MRKIVLACLFASVLFSASSDDKLFECTKIFQERKSELLVELERIDEEKQALQTLKIATEELLKKKKKALELKEEALDKKLSEVKAKEAKIAQMLKENKEILAKLTRTKMSKLAQTYSKMKASAAANILAKMPSKDAVTILQELKPKTVGQIFAKMDPKKASELTELLAK